MTMFRENRSDESRFASSLGADRAELGMGRNPTTFKQFRPTPPSLSPEQAIYSAATADKFEFIENPLPRHQDHYLNEVIELLREKGVPLMMINVPQYSEIHNKKIVERENWFRRFGSDIPLIGIPPAELYSGLSDEEITKLHYDAEHMNVNGNAYFTRAILPSIMEVFDTNAAKDR
jgi:hypothetical protein